MRAYVAGFVFSKDGSQVALINKLKPEWQKGKLNAIGGKVEALEVMDIVKHIESPTDAMVREFEEETGVFIPPGEWKYRVRLFTPGEFEVFFFAAFDDIVFEVKTKEAEEVSIFKVTNILNGEYPIIPNLKWLIPLCQDKKLIGPIEIEERNAA